MSLAQVITSSQRMHLADQNVDGMDLIIGSSTSPVTPANVADEFISIYVNPVLTNSTGKTYLVRAEAYLAPTDTFALQGSGLYTGRFLAGVKSGKTFKGSANQGYITGCQGKLDNKGVIGDNNSGGIYACAALSQVSGVGTYGTDAQLYGHWIDFQAGMGAPPSTCHMLNITNNSGQTIANGIYLYGGNGVSHFFNLNTCGGMVGGKVDADIAYGHYKKVAVMIDDVAGWVLVGFDS